MFIMTLLQLKQPFPSLSPPLSFIPSPLLPSHLSLSTTNPMPGNIDYQLHEKELRLVEEETQRRIKTLLEGSMLS